MSNSGAKRLMCTVPTVKNVHVDRMGWKSSPSALTRPNESVSCVHYYAGKYSAVRA